MATHYGNEGASMSNKFNVFVGKPIESLSLPSGSYQQDTTDCITCSIHKTNIIPIGYMGKQSAKCKAICGDAIIHRYVETLVDYTRSQLMIKFPKAGLQCHMRKPEMVQRIEMYLLQNELYPKRRELFERE